MTKHCGEEMDETEAPMNADELKSAAERGEIVSPGMAKARPTWEWLAELGWDGNEWFMHFGDYHQGWTMAWTRTSHGEVWAICGHQLLNPLTTSTVERLMARLTPTSKRPPALEYFVGKALAGLASTWPDQTDGTYYERLSSIAAVAVELGTMTLRHIEEAEKTK